MLTGALHHHSHQRRRQRGWAVEHLRHGELEIAGCPDRHLIRTLSSTGGIGMLFVASITGVVSSAAGIGSLRTGNFSGSISATGVLGMINLGKTSGVIAARQIKNFTAANLIDATILARANLGTDGQLGGGDDIFAAGQFIAMKITGAIASSFIGAGVITTDGQATATTPPPAAPVNSRDNG